MKLYPSALAKTFAVAGLFMVLSNLALNCLLFGTALFTSDIIKSILYALVVTPLIAAVVGFIIAHLYNYFLPAQ